MQYLLAFLMGGFLCVLAQLLIDFTKLTPARILVLFVVVGVAFSAFGWYKPLRDVFGCGISVPLLGFGGGIGEGVKKALAEEGALGILSGGLTATAAGVTAALLWGVLAAVVGKSKPKRL